MLTPLLLAATAALTPAPPPVGGVEWYAGSLDQAIAQAREKDSFVMVYFWRNGSDHCTALYQETLQNEIVPTALGDMVCLSANYDDKAGGKMFEIFQVATLPTILFLAPDGKPDDAIRGFIGAEDMVGELGRIRRGEGTVRGLTRAAAATEAGSDDAIETHWLLAGKHQDLGDQEAHDAVLAVLREQHDPGARTVVGARAHLWKIQADVQAQIVECHCEGEECSEECGYADSVAALDLAPLYAHAKRVKPEEARFEGWNSVANFEATREQPDLAVKAFVQASGLVPDAQRVSFPKNVAMWAIEAGDEATKRQKKLALDFAQRAAKEAKKLDVGSDVYLDTYGEAPVVMVQAEVMGALALAYDLNGNARKAKKAAEDALALAGDHADDLRQYLAKVLEG